MSNWLEKVAGQSTGAGIDRRRRSDTLWLAGAVGMSILTCACAQEPEPAVPVAEMSQDERPGGGPATEANDAGVEPIRVESEIASETPAKPPKIAAIVVNQAQGRSTDELGRIFAPAQDRVTECAKPGTGGTVLIDVKHTKSGSTHFAVRPGASVGPNERHCVLEALSTIESDDEVNQNRNPGPMPLPGFSSVITVSW